MFRILLFSSLVVLLIITLSNLSTQRKFYLTDGRGVVYKVSTAKQIDLSKNILTNRDKFYKNNKYLVVENSKLKFKFLISPQLKLSETRSSVSFEDFFTFPPILWEKIYSYPGALTNPEKTEIENNLLIKILAIKGYQEYIETWLEDFQEENNFNKEKMNINGIIFLQYQKMFGHKYNSILITKNRNITLMFVLQAKDLPAYDMSQNVVNVIESTFKWL